MNWFPPKKRGKNHCSFHEDEFCQYALRQGWTNLKISHCCHCRQSAGNPWTCEEQLCDWKGKPPFDKAPYVYLGNCNSPGALSGLSLSAIRCGQYHKFPRSMNDFPFQSVIATLRAQSSFFRLCFCPLMDKITLCVEICGSGVQPQPR